MVIAVITINALCLLQPTNTEYLSPLFITAQQSSDFTSNWAHAESCLRDDEVICHTAKNQNPSWWMATLKGKHRVDGITIVNRADCCGDRFRHVTVQLLDGNGRVIGTPAFIGTGSNRTHDAGLTSYSIEVFPPARARSVRIWKDQPGCFDDSCVLHMQSVHISVTTDVSLSKPTLWLHRPHTDCKFLHYWSRQRHQRYFYGDEPIRYLLQFVQSHLEHANCSSKKPIIVDVGAHDGNDTELWLDLFVRNNKCDVKPQLLLVEPTPSLAKRMEHHQVPLYERQGLTVIVVAAALSNKSGTMYLSQPGSVEASLSATEVPGSVRVNIVRADTLLRQLGVDSIPFLKIDTEGHDAKVLYGLGRYLEMTNMLMFECDHLEPQTEFIEVVRYLRSHGFTTYMVGTPFCIKLDEIFLERMARINMWQNCLVVRNNSPLQQVIPIVDCNGTVHNPFPVWMTAT